MPLYPGGFDGGPTQDGNLGFAVAPVLAVVTQAGGAWKSISGIFGGHPKDGERFTKNAEAYRAAVQGDQMAIEFLKYRTGRYGVADSLGRFGGPVGGWATQAAQDDAWKLYNSALAAWGIGIEETPGGGGQMPSSGPEGPLGQPLPGQTVQASMGYGPLVFAGLALALLVNKRGR